MKPDCDQKGAKAPKTDGKGKKPPFGGKTPPKGKGKK